MFSDQDGCGYLCLLNTVIERTQINNIPQSVCMHMGICRMLYLCRTTVKFQLLLPKKIMFLVKYLTRLTEISSVAGN
jgi:hypothetical protein